MTEPHDHQFPGEETPEGVEILLPCLICGFKPADAIVQLSARVAQLEADLAAMTSLAEHRLTTIDEFDTTVSNLKSDLEAERADLARVTAERDEAAPCRNGHVWSNDRGDDWTPENGTPCDCRKKHWGQRGREVREHAPEFDNHHNAFTCPYCRASRPSQGEPPPTERQQVRNGSREHLALMVEGWTTVETEGNTAILSRPSSTERREQ
jgi:hypothetical protein